MELVLLVLLVLGLVVLLNWVSDIGTPEDNREPYWRDASGRVWALYVAGPVKHGGLKPNGTKSCAKPIHIRVPIRLGVAIRHLG